MSKVRILGEVLANQIAAGEVVERPASVVKELVENAIDAGAANITVVIANAGRSHIEVVDDGVGMSRNDALLAVERFGTSKISEVGDLLSISTLGFRGEALPSIASVSKLTLMTACDSSAGEEIVGTQLSILAGILKNVSSRPAPRGTRVVVEDLFFNIPARRKFLRTNSTEGALIRSVVVDYALAYPQIRFSLIVDGNQQILASCSTTVEERIRSLGFVPERPIWLGLTGKADGGGMQLASSVNDYLKVEGVLSSPAEAVSNANRLRLFVNSRAIRDRLLITTVREAFGTMLKPGKYPSGCIFLSLDHSELDVNVHPRKTEVRFRQAGQVFAAIKLKIEEALRSQELYVPSVAPSVLAMNAVGGERSYATSSTVFIGPNTERPLSLVARESLSVAEPAMIDSALSGHPSEDRPGAENLDAGSAWQETLRPQFAREQSFKLHSVQDGSCSLELVKPGEGAFAHKDEVYSSQGKSQEGSFSLSRCRYVGQVFDCFLLFEDREVFAILDMHAAHERVMFVRLKDEFQTNGRLITQLLLVPQMIKAGDYSHQGFLDSRSLLTSLGFELEELDDGSLVLRAMPSLLAKESPHRLVAELCSLAEGQSWEAHMQYLVDSAISRLACHGSVRSGRKLKEVEVWALVDALELAGERAFCPHGRPVLKVFTKEELGRLFNR